MTDKPKKYCDGIDCAFCSEKEPCIYKIANRLESELKCKEQELQEAMDNYVQLDLQRVKEYNKLVDLYKAKEQECEALKAENKKLNKTIMYKCPQCGDEYLSPISASLYEENRKLKQRIIEIDRSYKNRQEELEQTLTEIKEIAEKRNYLDYNECLDDILQKISEVINDD